MTTAKPAVPSVATTLLAGLLLTSLPRPARAESFASYKYEDYAEARDRISVTTQSALLQQDLGLATQVKVQGVIDAIVGATPNGQPAPAGSDEVVLTTMHERRKAWNAELLHQFAAWSVDVRVANSRESDYVSAGWSVNAQAFFNEKNTTLLGGLGGTNDDVRVFYQKPWARKRTTDLMLGVNQLLDPLTSLTVNVGTGRATGYLNDQYKLVQKSIELAPGISLPFTFGENRPDTRTRWTLFALLNRAVPTAHAALEASYRFYHDSFGTDAHTVELTWLQHAGAHLIVAPTFRFHHQSAADFYHYNLDSTAIVPTGGAPHPAGPFYSSDYRLSALRTYTYGLRLTWLVSDRWQLDASVQRYDMRGTDGTTPASAYPTATIVDAGLRFAW